MVAFAPTVSSPNIAATADPEYTSYRWSRPIAPYEGDKSSELALKGGAAALTEGVNAADTAIKNSLTNNIEDEAGAKRDQYSHELSTTLDSLRGNKLKGADAYADASTDPSGKLDLLSTDPEKKDLPNDLRGLEGVLAKQEAVKANGKQSQSQYDGNIEALAKQYRAKWPGYREYIDSTFDRVTQRGPANQNIRAMIGDLDAYAEAAKAARGKTESILVKGVENIAGFDQIYSMWKQGKISDDAAIHKYNAAMSRDFEAKRLKSEWEIADVGSKLRSQKAEEAVNSGVSNTISNVISTIGSSMNAPGNLDKIMKDVAENSPETQGHAEQLATHLSAIKAQAIAAAAKEAMEVKNGSSIYRDLGPTKFKELIENHPMIKNLDTTIGLLNNKEHGLGTLAIRLQTEAVNNARWKALSENTDLGRALFGLEVVKGLGDTANSKILQDSIGKGGALTGLPEWFQRYNVLGATQPNEDDPKVPYEDKYITLNHAIKEVQANKSPDPVSFRRLFNTTVDNIVDPKTPDKIKQNYINFFTAPANLGILESIEPDHTDPQTGKKIPGKVWLYQQFTSEGIAKEVGRLSQSKPDLYKNYQNFVSLEGEHIAGQEIPKLVSLLENKSTKISYNDINQQFEIQDVKGKYSQPSQPYGRDIARGLGAAAIKAGAPVMSMKESLDIKDREEARESLFKVNAVLSSISTMAKYAPGKPDPNAYAFELLSRIAPPGSVTDGMLKAIMSTAPIKEEPKK